MKHRYSLEKSSKKFVCPSCEKKRFVRYVDNEIGDYIDEKVGLCDRANNCNYHLPPREYFKKNQGLNPFKKNEFKQTHKINTNDKRNKYNTIPQEQVLDTLMPHKFKNNDFTNFLYTLFSNDLTNQLINQFYIGTYEKWGRYSPVFWQIDKNGEIRSGKIMAYDKETGSRIKENDKSYITWYHSELKQQKLVNNFQLKQCLYGEYQLNTQPKDKVIGIVESEKTAIIMTALMPSLIWMACGSLHQIKKEIFLPLLGREIILFPDLNGFEKWEEKIKSIKKSGFNIRCDDFLEKNTLEIDKKEGYDLVDFFLIGL